MRLEREQRLDTICQRDNEPTGAYNHRFRLEFNAMQAAGVEIVATPFVPATVADQEAIPQALLEMEDKIMAIKFLRKLDRKRYGNWLDHLENELNEGRDIYPKIIGAYQQANGCRENSEIVANMTSQPSQRQQHQAIALMTDRQERRDRWQDGC
jgi:hypothetical protein